MEEKKNKFFKQKEFWFATAIIIFIVLFFNLNFFIGSSIEDPEREFAGITGVSTIDFGVYFSMIEQVRQGSVLTNNLYTTETQEGGLFHPLWITLGSAARLLNIDSVTIYHWSRVIFGIIFLYFLYFLSKQFIKNEKWRLFTLVCFGFAAGWGRWFSIFQKEYYQGNEVLRLLFSVDMWHSEGFVFLTLTHSSLFLITQLFLILSWWLLVFKKPILHWLSGLSLLLLGLMHPYDILIFWPVVLVWFALRFYIKHDRVKGWLKKLAPSILATLLLFVYYIFTMISNPNIGGWFNQNVTLPPSFFAVLTGYGWLWLGSLIGLIFLFKRIDSLPNKYFWLIAWFMTLPLLEFAPVAFARRFIHSFGAVIVIMAIIGLSEWWKTKGKEKWRSSKYGVSFSALAMILFLTMFITPLYQGVEDMVESYHKTWPSFVVSDDLDITKSLSEVEEDAIILAKPFLANIIPGFSGRFVYFGHPHQTLKFEQKYTKVQMFYAMKWHESKIDFLQNNKIDYLVWEKERASEMPDAWDIYYENESYVVYNLNYSKN